jgi:hypothetical protein
VRNIDSALRFGDFIPWRHRKMIEGFLVHENARLRAYAAEIVARDAEARREQAAWAEEEERMYGGLFETPVGPADQAPPLLDDLDGWEAGDIDIPF